MLKNLTNSSNGLAGLKRKKPDSCYEPEDDDDAFEVDCDVRLEQGGTALVRHVRKTSVTFCCAGKKLLITFFEMAECL
jgi:hypothetical protein